MKKLFSVFMLVILAFIAGCLTSSDDGGSEGGWQIYGYVEKANGYPINGVWMTLEKNGKTVAAATSGAYGYYVFNNISNGTYTVIPSKSGYTFSPTEVRNVVMNGSRVVVDTFVGTESY